MFTTRIVIDQILVLEDGQIQVREATRMFDRDVEVGKTYHRHVVAPGDDLSQEHGRVQAIARVVHTSEVIQAFRERVAVGD